MKRLMILSLMFLGVAFIAPVWSHHPAEGIVSDDIWQMVNDNLIEAGSPHLTIDFDNIMDSMGVADCSGSTDCGGRVLLVTSIVVETADLQVYLDEIDAASADLAINRIPSGKTSSEMAATFEVVTEDLSNGMTIISIYEPVGSGDSQIDPDFAPKNGG